MRCMAAHFDHAHPGSKRSVTPQWSVKVHTPQLAKKSHDSTGYQYKALVLTAIQPSRQPRQHYTSSGSAGRACGRPPRSAPAAAAGRGANASATPGDPDPLLPDVTRRAARAARSAASSASCPDTAAAAAAPVPAAATAAAAAASAAAAARGSVELATDAVAAPCEAASVRRRRRGLA